MTKADDVVAELVAVCIERSEREGASAIEAVCAEHPEHADTLREKLRRLADMGLLDEPDAVRSASATPNTLGGYTLIRQLGAGGMGVVHLARQGRPARDVALKLVRPEQLWFPGARERFAREVELVAALQHPGIVPVYEVGEERGVPWLSMEFVEGATLEGILRDVAGRDVSSLSGGDLRRAVLSDAARQVRTTESSNAGDAAIFSGTWVEAVWAIGEAVADALQHAHDAGVLHRDIKPSNIIVGVDGRVRLLDFGLAVRDGSSRLTVTGQLLGSLAYMSPERLIGHGHDRDPRGDTYSLGATLFELLTLRPPFVAESLERLRRVIVESRAPSPAVFNAAVSRDAAAVCLVALEPDPDRRYVQPSDFAADLRRLRAGEPVLARPLSRARRILSWALRQPIKAAALVFALLVLVGGPLGYALLEARHADDLRASLAVARDERVRAEGNLDLARDAVDSLLLDVGDTDFDLVPGMEGLRRTLHGSAIEFYDTLLERSPTSQEIAVSRLDAMNGLAHLLGRTGDVSDAIELWSRVRDESEERRAGGATGASRARLGELRLSSAFNVIGNSAAFDRAEPAAIDAMRALVDRVRRQLESAPDSTLRQKFGSMLGGFGLALVKAGEREEAASVLRESLVIFENAEPTPGNLARRMSAVHRLTFHSLETGASREEYIDIVRHGVAIQQTVAELFPEDDSLPTSMRDSRARLFSALAHVLLELDQDADALRFVDAAIHDGEKLVSESPLLPKPFVFLMSDIEVKAGVVFESGAAERAKGLLRIALSRAEAAIVNWPGEDDVRYAAARVASRLCVWSANDRELDEAKRVMRCVIERIRNDERVELPEDTHHVRVSMCLWLPMELKYGDLDFAAEASEALARLADDDPQHLSVAASTLLRCATENDRLTPSDVTAGITRALDLLEHAIDQGFIIKPEHASDAEPWNVIADHPRFPALRERMML